MKGFTGTAFPARLRWVVALFVLALLVLVVELFNVQWLQRDELRLEASKQAVRDRLIAAPRGMIVDRDGAPLAVSTTQVTLQAGRLLWEEPRPLKRDEKRSLSKLAEQLGLDADEFVKRIEAQGSRARWEELAAALGEPPDALRRRLENVGPAKPMEGETDKAFAERVNKVGTRNAYPLALRLPPERAAAVLSLKIPDIVAMEQYRRYYPYGETTAQLIGRVDHNGHGQEGLEKMFDNWLGGTPGKQRELRDGNGRVLEDLGIVQSPQAGKDLRLSIDLRLQNLANLELARALEQSKATWGCVVLVDVGSGEILALANQPTYNPNDRKAYNPRAARNHALLDNIEPGSTIKPLSMLAALQTGRWKPQDQVSLLNAAGRRELMVRGRKSPIKDVAIGGPNEPNLTQILIESSNVGISKIALDIGAEPIREMMQRLGLGQGSSLGFPAEQFGKLPAHKRWGESETTNLAYGYGLEVTAVQLAQAYATIANDGLMKPLTLLRQSEIPQGEQVIDKTLAKTVRGMLQQVVHGSRMRSLARVEGYRVAGKSGTADKNEPGKKGKTRALFAGFAPADAPRFALVVVLDEPEKIPGKRTAHYGGAVAAPVFSKVMEGTLRLMQVPPDMPAARLAGASN
ncbi:peptidoglycan D,D-transpeptidase FtsI family protein [Ventosimonas gracilis]|uniref:peptidoglycan D,D-transpeptidase FtsI family protein n=1 Tax=Ventosimonas gracilis TaxID=1680762 RepID=UPI0009A22370|nr:penicillin-binding protein 2 [Ventosimonas gracilis]